MTKCRSAPAESDPSDNAAHLRPTDRAWRTVCPKERLDATEFIVLLAIVAGFFFFPATPAHSRSLRVSVTSKDSLLARFLSDHSPAPIEGVWLWSDGSYELTIVPNRFDFGAGYDYVAIATDGLYPGTHEGRVKMLLKASALPAICPGLYLAPNGSRTSVICQVVQDNILQFDLGGERQNLLRLYPRQEASASKGETRRIDGTAFFVAPGILVTNFHVIDGATEIRIIALRDTLAAELILQDKQNDLALLRATRRGSGTGDSLLLHTCVPLASGNNVATGERVFVVGFPLTDILGSELSVSEGIVNSTVGLDDDPRTLRISVPIQPGNSGSPLLDGSGVCVGVVTSTVNNRYLYATHGAIGQNLNFAIKATYLRSLMAMAPVITDTCTSTPAVGGPNATAVFGRTRQAVVRLEALIR